MIKVKDLYPRQPTKIATVDLSPSNEYDASLSLIYKQIKLNALSFEDFKEALRNQEVTKLLTS